VTQAAHKAYFLRDTNTVCMWMGLYVYGHELGLYNTVIHSMDNVYIIIIMSVCTFEQHGEH